MSPPDVQSGLKYREGILWVPHVWGKSTLNDAISFAFYRGNNNGQICSEIRAVGFPNNDEIVEMVFALQK